MSDKPNKFNLSVVKVILYDCGPRHFHTGPRSQVSRGSSFRQVWNLLPLWCLGGGQIHDELLGDVRLQIGTLAEVCFFQGSVVMVKHGENMGEFSHNMGNYGWNHEILGYPVFRQSRKGYGLHCLKPGHHPHFFVGRISTSKIGCHSWDGDGCLSAGGITVCLPNQPGESKNHTGGYHDNQTTS
jgi:hypothetical protein